MSPRKERKYKQSLCELFPSNAKEWYPKKNGGLNPKDVTPGSGKKVWWICEKRHEWQTKIYHRSNGSGCPYCSRRKKWNEASGS